MQYDGTSIAKNQDIVFVSFNYRLNVLGFPSAPDLPIAQNNLGYLDQEAAFRWVQDNIAAFGGDKTKVTIMVRIPLPIYECAEQKTMTKKLTREPTRQGDISHLVIFSAQVLPAQGFENVAMPESQSSGGGREAPPQTLSPQSSPV